MSLAADLARAVDPAALAERIGMTPDEWQRDVLRSSADRILLNCCRQSGKSTTAAVLAVHTALYEPESLVLLLSPSQRQSQELFRKCTMTYRTLGRPVASEAENQLSLALENGSRIVSLPGSQSTVRGYSGVRLLVVDEGAQVPDDLYYSVRPMLAVSGGRLVVMSTPFGRRGFFFEEWESGKGWERVRITAEQCPRISPDFLEDERRTIGDWFYRQEYECTFVEVVDALFSYDHVQAAVTDDVAPLFPGRTGG